jgi:hypothetical protein
VGGIFSRHGFAALATLAIGCAIVGASDASSTVFGGETRTFPYRQRKFLFSREGAGALVHVPEGTSEGASLPVLVFLHGQNADRHMHPRFDSGPGDLRKIALELRSQGKTAPFLIAAPTHTRYATGATVMWPTFDVEHFLDATDAALAGRARTDRAHVVVVGHSAAGCNPHTGLFAASTMHKVKAVVAVDTCLDAEITQAYLALAPKTDLQVYWTTTPGWKRAFPELEKECLDPSHKCRVTEMHDLPSGSHPHDAILGEALRRALPGLFPVAAKPTPVASSEHPAHEPNARDPHEGPLASRD